MSAHGEPSATVADWYDRHVDAVHAYAARRVGADLARDVVGDTFRIALEQFDRIQVLRGSWLWEVDVQGIATVDDALALFAGLRVVDEETWRAVLPADAVTPDQRDALVLTLLEGVPLPDGFDPDSVVRSDATTERYQFVARVSGAVACAWLDQWFTAQDSGDSTRQQEAADALATTRTWPMLIEIADQGGWTSAVWEWADAVNGGPGLPSGGGAVAPSRDVAASSLGCAF